MADKTIRDPRTGMVLLAKEFTQPLFGMRAQPCLPNVLPAASWRAPITPCECGGDSASITFYDCSGNTIASGAQIALCSDLPAYRDCNGDLLPSDAQLAQCSEVPSYLDCSGNPLESGAQVAQCSDLVTYSVESTTDAIVVASGTVDGTTTYEVTVQLSTAAGNALTLNSDGLMVTIPETGSYVLKSCAGEDLASGTKVAQCDEVPAQGYATYTLNEGGVLSRVEPGLMAADADVFATAELQFQNSDGALLFTVDVAAMLNQLATTVINRVLNVAKDPLMLTVTENTTLTIEQIIAEGYSGLIVLVDSASAVVLTIPNVAPGKSFAIMQIGTGSVSFAGDGTTITVNAPSDTTGLPRTQYSAMTLLCTGADTWIAMGDMGASA